MVSRVVSVRLGLMVNIQMLRFQSLKRVRKLVVKLNTKSVICQTPGYRLAIQCSIDCEDRTADRKKLRNEIRKFRRVFLHFRRA